MATVKTKAVLPNPKPSPPLILSAPSQSAKEAPKGRLITCEIQNASTGLNLNAKKAAPGIKKSTPKNNAGVDKSPMESVGGHIPRCSSQGKSCHDSCPIEKLPTLGRNTVNRERSFSSIPQPENKDQSYKEEGCGSDIRNSEAQVKDIGGHSPKHGNHDNCKPVHPLVIPLNSKLKLKSNCQHEKTSDYCWGFPKLLYQKIRGIFADTSAQDFNDPESKSYLGNL